MSGLPVLVRLMQPRGRLNATALLVAVLLRSVRRFHGSCGTETRGETLTGLAMVSTSIPSSYYGADGADGADTESTFVGRQTTSTHGFLALTTLQHPSQSTWSCLDLDLGLLP